METTEIDVDENMLKVAYLFMLADGAVSDTELEVFEAFGKQFWNFDNRRKEIISEAKRLLNQMTAVQAVKEICSECNHYDARKKRFFLWTLINIGHADGNYSEIEKNIVRATARELEVNKTYVDEFEDSALVLAMNEARKSKLDGASDDKEKIMRQIEAENEILAQSVQELCFIG